MWLRTESIVTLTSVEFRVNVINCVYSRQRGEKATFGGGDSRSSSSELWRLQLTGGRRYGARHSRVRLFQLQPQLDRLSLYSSRRETVLYKVLWVAVRQRVRGLQDAHRHRFQGSATMSICRCSCTVSTKTETYYRPSQCVIWIRRSYFEGNAWERRSHC